VTFLSEAEGSQTAADDSQAPTTGIWIPASAILTNPDGSASVLSAVDGRLQTRKVSTGRRSGDRVEITAGLTAGDAIAATGLERLHEGQRVE
jgi:multidrug efflux pump subunit AcrA (membrane-fusion protein)